MALSLCAGAALVREHMKDPVAKAFEVFHAVCTPFQNLDLIVASFCKSVCIRTEKRVRNGSKPIVIGLRASHKRRDLALLRFFDPIGKEFLLLVRIRFLQDGIE